MTINVKYNSLRIDIIRNVIVVSLFSYKIRIEDIQKHMNVTEKVTFRQLKMFYCMRKKVVYIKHLIVIC